MEVDREVICLSCDEQAVAADEARPGGSAQREYERRRENRISRQRERYGRIGGWFADHSSGPQHERAWAKGAAGEDENARRLEKRLAGYGVILLHDRHLPGQRSNIDHIAVGPSGVFVIDSKKLSGKVRVDWRGRLFSERPFDLYVNRRKRTALVAGVERQVELVRRALEDEGLAGVPVRGALCMADPEGLPLFGHLKIRDVPIDGTRYISKLIRVPGALSGDRVPQVAAALEHRFPPA